MTANGSGFDMKMVVAIIRHERLQEVQDVLDECGVSGVTVTEVKGCGAQRGYTEKYRGASVHISLRPRPNGELHIKKGGRDFPARPSPCDLLGCGAYVCALLDPGADRGRCAGVSDQAVHHLAVPEKSERGDAHHAVADGDLLVGINVQLADLDLAGKLA